MKIWNIFSHNRARCDNSAVTNFYTGDQNGTSTHPDITANMGILKMWSTRKNNRNPDNRKNMIISNDSNPWANHRISPKKNTSSDLRSWPYVRILFCFKVSRYIRLTPKEKSWMGTYQTKPFSPIKRSNNTKKRAKVRNINTHIQSRSTTVKKINAIQKQLHRCFGPKFLAIFRYSHLRPQNPMVDEPAHFFAKAIGIIYGKHKTV